MIDRKLFAPISRTRTRVVSTLVAILLSATALSVELASAQQPPPAAPAAPRPAAPRPAAPGAPAAQRPAAPAAAQKPAAPGAPAAQAAAPAAAEGPPLIYSPWMKMCDRSKEPGAKEVCFIAKDGRLENGQPAVSVAVIDPEGAPKKLLRIIMPLGVSLVHGSRMLIDNKDPATAPFIICFVNGCMAEYEATTELLGKLKVSQSLTLQAVNMQGNPFGLPLPLVEAGGNSFAKAFDGPPTDPKVFEAQQQKLQEELQKRADDARKKLETQAGAPPK
jgi:invasion protein IalB